MSDTPSIGKVPGMDKIDNFLTNKEKLWGRIGTFLMVGAGGVLLYWALPFINQLFKLATEVVARGLLLAGLLAIVGILYMVLSSPRFWAQVWYLRNIFFRKFTRLVVQIAPTEHIEAYANEFLGEQLSTFQGAATKVFGSRDRLAENVTTYEGQIEEWTQQANALKNRHFDEQEQRWDNEDAQFKFQSLSNQITTIEGQLKRSRVRLEKLEYYCQIMEKMQRALKFQIENIRFFAKMLIQEYEEMKEMGSAVSAASSVLGGNVKTDIYNDAVDYVKAQIGYFSGQVDMFIKAAPEFLNAPDLANMAGEDRLMARLKDFDRAADGLVSSAQETSKAIAAGGVRGVIQGHKAAAPVSVVAAGRRTSTAAPAVRKYGKGLND